MVAESQCRFRTGYGRAEIRSGATQMSKFRRHRGRMLGELFSDASQLKHELRRGGRASRSGHGAGLIRFR